MPTGEKRPGHKGSTSAVYRWLSKDHKSRLYGYQGYSVWERMPYDSLEVFTKAAKQWLGDQSELRRTTIETADWPEVYEYFKRLNDEGKKE